MCIATLGLLIPEQMRVAAGHGELARAADGINNHLLAFGVNHTDFLFSIFAILICHENTCPCSEPSPEAGGKHEGVGVTPPHTHTAGSGGVSTCHREITGFGFTIRHWFPLCDLVSFWSLLVSFTE